MLVNLELLVNRVLKELKVALSKSAINPLQKLGMRVTSAIQEIKASTETKE